jgi:hypothetical protein
VEAAVRQLRQLEEAQVDPLEPVERRRVAGLAEDDDERAGDVVGAVAAAGERRRTECVLDEPALVRQPQQVLEARRRQPQRARPLACLRAAAVASRR